MVEYIGLTGQRMAQRASVLPSVQELTAAEKTLSQSPVPGYREFTGDEVRVLAAYRCQFSAGIKDIVWASIVRNKPEAWLYAVHEAAEIEAFVEMQVDPFDLFAWRQHLPAAHLRACIQENIFLNAWATHLGYTTGELALEMQNPIRKQLSGHAIFVHSVQSYNKLEFAPSKRRTRSPSFLSKDTAVNVRLVVIDPERREPSYPLAVVDKRSGIILCGDDWVLPLTRARLEEVTEEDVRLALDLSPAHLLFLSPARTLPNYVWLSTEMLQWMEQWREEFLKQEPHRALLQRAS